METNAVQTKEELIARLKEAVDADNIENLTSVFKEVKVNFQELTEEEKQSQRKAYNATAEDGDKYEFKPNPLDEEFNALAKAYKEKRSAHKAELAKKQELNYENKRVLIEKLDALVHGSLDNIGASFQRFYEIRDEWKTIGDVNQARFKQLQHDYSSLVDLFYYNIGIHKELQNYDLKKNGEEKQAVIDKLKGLSEVESIRQLEHYIKQYQNEWDNIGPTEQETWETLKEEYWSLVNSIYEKIKLHYQNIREKQKAALEKKETLLAQLQETVAKVEEAIKVKDWNQLTQKVIALQNEWKETGYSKKANENKLFEDFRTLANKFFEQKSVFFEKLKSKQGDVAEKKKELIKKAERLKDSKQWKETSEAIINLQKQWKRAGQAHPKIDQKLWNEFRTYCDEFFNAKKEYFDTLDDRKADNTKEKETILESIKNSKTAEDVTKVAESWFSVGVVAKNKMKTLQDKFDKEIEKLSEKLNLEEIENQVFKAKITAFKQKENAQELLDSEKKYIQSQIENIKEELYQYENNMSFFGPSKGAQKLKEVVEKKMETAQQKMEEWKNKLKML